MAINILRRLGFARPAEQTIQPVSQAQKTLAQTSGSGWGFGGPTGFMPMGMIGGYSVSPGTLAMYREMRCNPTIALALAATILPVKAAPWSVEADDDVPEDWVKFVQDQILPKKRGLVKAMADACWLGFAPFEVIWNADGGMLGLERIKPLLQELSTAMLDDRGNLVSIKNTNATLTSENFAWFIYDPQGDDPYGRSLFENLRAVYAGWKDGVKRMASYIAKNAGIIPQVHYPDGKGPGIDGVERDNWEHARTILASISNGQGVTIPTDQIAQWAADAVADGKMTSVDALAWRISFVESRSGAGSEILDGIKHFEALMCRGMLWPERALTEGTAGTKAEAEVHGNIGLEAADDLAGEIVACVNDQIIDELLVANFGPDAKGKVRICAGPLSDDDKAYFRGILSTVLSNPANTDLLMELTDLDALLDKAEIPKAEEVIDPLKVRDGENDPTPPAEPPPDPKGNGDAPPEPEPPKPPAGNGGSKPDAAKMTRGARALLMELNRRNASSGK